MRAPLLKKNVFSDDIRSDVHPLPFVLGLDHCYIHANLSIPIELGLSFLFLMRNPNRVICCILSLSLLCRYT
jgi:hypothetical protein